MRMTRHLWAKGRLERFVDQELGDDLARRVQEHIDECAMCRGEVTSLLGLRAALQQRLGLRVDADSIARLRAWATDELPTLLP